MKYQIVHIPKTGGCALWRFLSKNYPDKFETMAHEFKIKHYENPIVTIRSPMSRISSIYRFWTSGSEAFRWERKMTFCEFLDEAERVAASIGEEEKDVSNNRGGEVHALPQARWIGIEDYAKTIVMTYDRDMNENVFNLLEYLGLQRPTEKMEAFNVTNDTKEIRFTIQEFKKILQIYHRDFALWNDVKCNPEKFKKVISSSTICDKPLSDYLLLSRGA